MRRRGSSKHRRAGGVRGSRRFFYEIEEAERIVFMIAAAHRGSAY